MTLDPDAAGVLEAVRRLGAPPYQAMSPGEARAAYAASRAATVPEPPPVAEIWDTRIERPGAPPLPIRVYRPVLRDAEPAAALVFCHGGGWVLGSIETHDGLCRHLAAQAGCTVLSVEYRLAPESKFQAAVEDALAATEWAFLEAPRLGLDPNRIAVGGDSAGGTLAAVVCLMRRDAGLRLPRMQLLLYPATDLAMATPSYEEFGDGYLLTRASMEWFADLYLRDAADRGDWRASPLMAGDLAGLPPAFILTAGYDPLRDEGEAYGARLVAAGVPVHAWRVPGQVHGFLPMGKVMTCSQPVLDMVARHLAFQLA